MKVCEISQRSVQFFLNDSTLLDSNFIEVQSVGKFFLIIIMMRHRFIEKLGENAHQLGSTQLENFFGSNKEEMFGGKELNQI